MTGALPTEVSFLLIREKKTLKVSSVPLVSINTIYNGAVQHMNVPISTAALNFRATVILKKAVADGIFSLALV